MNGAEKFFRRIKEDGQKANAVVYGTLMKGYSKLDSVEKVMRVYERMGVEPNQTIYTTSTIAWTHMAGTRISETPSFGSKKWKLVGTHPTRKRKISYFRLPRHPKE